MTGINDSRKSTARSSSGKALADALAGQVEERQRELDQTETHAEDDEDRPQHLNLWAHHRRQGHQDRARLNASTSGATAPQTASTQTMLSPIAKRMPVACPRTMERPVGSRWSSVLPKMATRMCAA